MSTGTIMGRRKHLGVAYFNVKAGADCPEGYLKEKTAVSVCRKRLRIAWRVIRIK